MNLENCNFAYLEKDFLDLNHCICFFTYRWIIPVKKISFWYRKSYFSVLLQIRKKLYVMFSTFESGAFIWSGYLLLSSSEWRWTCEPYLFLHYYSPRKPLVFQGFESLSFPASYYFYKLQTQKLVELYPI